MDLGHGISHENGLRISNSYSRSTMANPSTPEKGYTQPRFGNFRKGKLMIKASGLQLIAQLYRQNNI